MKADYLRDLDASYDSHRDTSKEPELAYFKKESNRDSYTRQEIIEIVSEHNSRSRKPLEIKNLNDKHLDDEHLEDKSDNNDNKSIFSASKS